jgi:hypothetical protein
LPVCVNWPILMSPLAGLGRVLSTVSQMVSVQLLVVAASPRVVAEPLLVTL